jgi:hypothetical protein
MPPLLLLLSSSLLLFAGVMSGREIWCEVTVGTGLFYMGKYTVNLAAMAMRSGEYLAGGRQIHYTDQCREEEEEEEEEEEAPIHPSSSPRPGGGLHHEHMTPPCMQKKNIRRMMIDHQSFSLHCRDIIVVAERRG